MIFCTNHQAASSRLEKKRNVSPAFVCNSLRWRFANSGELDSPTKMALAHCPSYAHFDCFDHVIWRHLAHKSDHRAILTKAPQGLPYKDSTKGLNRLYASFTDSKFQGPHPSINKILS